jgi:hypothetical protein
LTEFFSPQMLSSNIFGAIIQAPNLIPLFCAGWGYTVAFYKVLFIKYIIIHPLYHSPLSSPPHTQSIISWLGLECNTSVSARRKNHPPCFSLGWGYAYSLCSASAFLFRFWLLSLPHPKLSLGSLGFLPGATSAIATRLQSASCFLFLSGALAYFFCPSDITFPLWIPSSICSYSFNLLDGTGLLPFRPLSQRKAYSKYGLLPLLRHFLCS